MGRCVKIRTVMAKPVFVPPTATKRDLFQALKRHPDAEVLIVAGRDRRFQGDIHIDDLFLMLLPNEEYEEIGVELAFDLERKFFASTARQLMRRHDFSCGPDEEVLEVALQLAGLEVNEIPVVNRQGRVVGVVSQRRLVRHLRAP